VLARPFATATTKPTMASDGTMKSLPRISALACFALLTLGCARGPHDSSIVAHADASIEVGSPAPTLRAVAHDGTVVDLAELRGRPVVVFFYPKDETPGCTKEACSFRDAWERLSKRNVVLLGVSSDSAESHRAFVAHHKLPFLLLSDADGRIAQAFGVPRILTLTARQTFVIGPDGRIAHLHRSVDPVTHAAEIEAELP
jgi:thioredoxin-dependent peroxiredoxin